MNIYQELKARGFIYQETDAEAIEKKLATEKVVFYCGFDPTGSSLHVGHLLPVMAMRMLQKAGHIPTVLVGGATGAIGDPSGRSTARNMLTMDIVKSN
ncbi:MAG: tyrosine--tRNA ligase, partial [Lentisphaeria bacterium]|nr:tyrosine--tRNA ligase [Lentisphaeria bacterium]